MAASFRATILPAASVAVSIATHSTSIPIPPKRPAALPAASPAPNLTAQVLSFATLATAALAVASILATTFHTRALAASAATGPSV